MIEQPASYPAASVSGATRTGALVTAIAQMGGIAALIGLTVGLAVTGNGHIGVAICPPLIVTLVYIIWKAPMRLTMCALMFCTLTLESPYATFAGGQFKSPLFTIGTALTGNLWMLTGVQALHFTGLDCLTVYLLFIVLYRRATGSRIDRRDQVQTANPMSIFAWVAFLSIAVFWAYGVARGGSLNDSFWQVQKLVYLPIIFFLFQAALRGPADYGSLAGVLVAAAVVRSVAAILIRTYFSPAGGQELAVATTHEDSILFASAFTVLLAGLLGRLDWKRVLFCFPVLPLLIWGMVANTRRLVWVELVAVMLAFLLLTWSEVKSGMKRAAVRALPVLVLYGAVGWRSSNPIFAPIQALQSVTEPESDASGLWRDHENFNLITTLANHPLLGSGFGHEYIEYWPLEDISQSYPQYRYNPHNSILALWNSAGLLGFAGFFTFLVTGVFLASRSYPRARHADDRSAALSVIGIVLVYLIQDYGDVGLTSWTGVFILAPALAIVAKLAVHTGAWPARRRARRWQEKA